MQKSFSLPQIVQARVGARLHGPKTGRFPQSKHAEVGAQAQARGLRLRNAVFTESDLLVNQLLKQKVSLNSADDEGVTAMHIAATQDNRKVITWLLRNHADIHAVDRDGFSALTWACIKGHRMIVTQLLEAAADPNGVTVKAPNRTMLALAGERNNVGVMQELVRCKAAVNAKCSDGSTALMCAAHQEQEDAVQFLIRHGAKPNDIDKEGWTALMYAGNSTRLAKAGPEAAAICRRSLDCLLYGKADVNQQTPQGISAAMVAACRDRWPFIQTLLEVHADINMESVNGSTALFDASRKGSEQVVRGLIKLKVDLNKENMDKETPMMLAEQEGHAEIVRILLRHGAIPKAAPKKKGKKGKKK